MDSARWDRIQELFHQTAEFPQSEWLSHLKHLGVDDLLADQVLALLREDFEGTRLDNGLAKVAGDVFAPATDHPKHFGPYQIIRILGEGGTPPVYLTDRTD